MVVEIAFFSEATVRVAEGPIIQGRLFSPSEAALANGRGKADPRDRRIADLRKQLFERDRVIGELTIANRILKKTADEPY